MSLKFLPYKLKLIPFVHCNDPPLQMLSSCPAPGWDQIGVDWWYIQNEDAGRGDLGGNRNRQDIVSRSVSTS